MSSTDFKVADQVFDGLMDGKTFGTDDVETAYVQQLQRVVQRIADDSETLALDLC